MIMNLNIALKICLGRCYSACSTCNPITPPIRRPGGGHPSNSVGLECWSWSWSPVAGRRSPLTHHPWPISNTGSRPQIFRARLFVYTACTACSRRGLSIIGRTVSYCSHSTMYGLFVGFSCYFVVPRAPLARGEVDQYQRLEEHNCVVCLTSATTQQLP